MCLDFFRNRDKICSEIGESTTYQEYRFPERSSIMKEEYIKKITELLRKTDDLSLLDFILQLLLKYQ